MHGGRRFEWALGIVERPLHALIVAGALLLLPLLHCPTVFRATPETQYRTIESRFISGDLQEADQEASRAAADYETKSPSWATKLRLLQARVEIYRGQSPRALVLLQPELPTELQGSAAAVLRDSLLAIAYARTENLPRAEEALRKAEMLYADEASRAQVLLAKGIVSGENGRIDEAEQDFEASLVAANHTGDEFQQVQALLNIAVNSLWQDHYEDALEQFDRASTLAQHIGARQAMEKAEGNAGVAIYRMGDFPRALAYAEAAERLAQSLGSPIDEIAWLQDAGFARSRMNDLKAARDAFQRSYELAKSIQNNDEAGDALLALASVSLQENDLSGSLALSREAERVALQSGNKRRLFEPKLLEAQAIARQGDLDGARVQLVGMLSEQDGSAPRPFERWQIQSALARVYEQDGNHAAADAWFGRAIDTFQQQRDLLSDIGSKLPFGENATSLYDDYMEELLQQGRSTDALLLLDRSRAEALHDGAAKSSPASANDRQAWAHDPSSVARRVHGTILVYSLRPQTSYLWAVSPDETRFFKLPGKEKLAPLVENHMRAVVEGKDVLSQADSPGAQLYRALVEPVRAQIPSGSRVFVVADGDLSHLNFETLVTSGEKPHFLIEDADVVNAKSISLLAARKRDSKNSGRRLLLVGDPVYDHSEYAKLPNARQEVTDVATHFAANQRAVLTGPEATRSAYLASHPEGYRYIHFVAHATASESVPLDSAVVLSAQPGEPDVYKLYARDIMNGRLQADLVTISACYGSGVRSYSGEGLVGLAWAFLRAGSHNVVGALWEVSDASTPLLMNDLYGGLAKGQNPDVALRAAKLAMLQRGGVFRKPFYWGAFQLYSGS